MSLQFPSRRMLLRAAAAGAAALALSACGKEPPAFKGSDITGTQLGKDLALTDHNGTRRTLQDFAGKVQVVFFGFTQCPDVCPTALAELAQVMQKLGDDAGKVQVLLITVDPERDTPDVLKQYVTTFDPRFLGLTGTPDEIRRAAASFKAYYAKVPRDNGDYTMDHTAAFYLFDAKGQPRVLANSTLGGEALAHDISALLAQG
ncbi:SCO family protein [Bordetella sp. 2513F-2]